ncbi:regulatory protein weta [Achaetomium macrosporum]|uniref:Regulatory protein weta n=1 Tax=Achaetomium macrosporum TaxID=79813 RepID=A0AAN7C6S8_9PEZI|nr:regulatory protein weta [Achaetomium macrosporum]
MAGVQGIAVTARGITRSANKEKDSFCWQDTSNDAGASDFFDQYVQLGDSDAESVTGRGGGGLGQFYGASDLTMSPHMSFEEFVPAGGAQQATGAVQEHTKPGATANNAAGSTAPGVPNPRQHRQDQLHPQYRGASNMKDFNKPEIEVEGVPYGGFTEAPGGGSISDSELLKLEGLTMRSPRIQIPQLSASEPASPPSQSTSPSKASRLGSFYDKIRSKAATLHAKTKQRPEVKAEPEASLPIPIMSAAQIESGTSGRPRPQGLQFSKSQLPSPPPTSGMSIPAQRPLAGNSASGASFVNAFLDDTFIPNGPQFVGPLQLNGSVMPQTPLRTPLLDGWQLPMSAPNGKPAWTAPGTYFPGVDGDAANMWWDPSADAMETDPGPLSYNATANARNASLNLAIQLQHQQGFEYPAPPGTEDNLNFATSGLMIHMPQPRGVPSAVLHSDTANHRPTRADQHRRPKPRAPSSGARHRQYAPGVSPRKAGTASGASGSSTSRIGSASPSPKISATSTITGSPSSSTGRGGRLHRRSASMQTLHNQPVSSSSLALPAADGPTSHAAIRKRRSWTGRRTSSSSSSLHHQYHSLAVAAAVAGAGSVTNSVSNSPSRRRTATTSGGGGGSSRPVSFTTTTPSSSFPAHPTSTTNENNSNKRTSSTTLHEPKESTDDGFVNYTPQDRALLMTGVAPSGSSKTKARREREAAERQREFRARLAKMVEAAGGDVRKLELVGLQLVREKGGGYNDVRRVDEKWDEGRANGRIWRFDYGS